MKKLLFFLCVVSLASCAKNYNNKIVFRGVAQSCPFVTQDSANILSAEGLASIIPAKNVGSNPQRCDSVYTVEMTTYQKWNSGYKRFLYAGIIVCIIGFGLYIWLTSSGTDKFWTLAISFGTLFIGGSLIGGFYYFSESRQIRKADYVAYPGGDLEAFWSTPAQIY